MTLPDERTRALLWAGGFLIEVARDMRIPLSIRQRAAEIARHFPTVQQLSFMAMTEAAISPDPALAMPEDVSLAALGCQFGLLFDSTRLAWPED
jgi:hypothetical protein